MADYKRHHGQKDVERLKKAIEFLFRKAEAAKKNMDSVGKHAFEKHACELNSVLYKDN